MPTSDELPEALSQFARKNALELSHTRWPHDIRRLLSVLERFEAQRAEPLGVTAPQQPSDSRQQVRVAGPPSPRVAPKDNRWKLLAAALGLLVLTGVAFIAWQLVGTPDEGTGTGPGSSTLASEASPTPLEEGPTVKLPIAAVSATSTAPSGFDAGGATVTYEAENTIDSDPSTAWRTEGEGIGVTLTLSLSGQSTIRRVGLIPGYSKVDPTDGTDRFFQNRRVRSVRWLFPDGSSVVQTFRDKRTLQYVEVNVVANSVTVEILDSTAPGGRDYTAISEIEILGTAP